MDKSRSDNRLLSLKTSKSLLFVILFAAIYSALHYAYYLTPDSFLRDVVYHFGIVNVCIDVINTVSSIQVYGNKNLIQSSMASLEIVRGCDGIGVMMLLIAAIMAFSASWKQKIIGLLVGLLLMYAINIARISGLYFVVAYNESLFLPIHTFFAPTLIVILCCLFFLWWVSWSSRESSNTSAA